MASTTVLLGAPPPRIFTLLEDPRSLAYFVVGSRTIRRFDPQWPELHSTVDHTVGVRPFVGHDDTEVVEVDPPRHLALEARFRPFGIMQVVFDLADHAEGTELTVNEFPIKGPIAAPGVAKVVDGLVALRNLEMGRRLRKLVEAREEQRLMAGA